MRALDGYPWLSKAAFISRELTPPRSPRIVEHMKLSMNAKFVAAIGMGLWLGMSGLCGADSKQANSSSPESFQIRNHKFGDLLRPEDANNADGTRIVLYPAQPWKCLTWKLHPAGESVYWLQNHFTLKTFAPDSKKDGSATSVVQVPFNSAKAGLTWRITKLSDGLYQVLDAKSGQAMTAVDSGGSQRIVIAPWADKPEQKWELLKAPEKLTM